MAVARELSYRPENRKDGGDLAYVGNGVKARTLTEKEVREWSLENSTEMKMLRDWLERQLHLPQNLTDEQLLIFLHSSFGSVERTKDKIDSHFTIRTHSPEIFASRSIYSEDVVQASKVARISPLPNATPDGSNVIFVDCADAAAENYNFTTVLKATGLALDALVRYFPREESNVIVFDMRNSVLAHVLKTNFVSLKKMMLFAQTSLMFRLSRVHVINASPLVNHFRTLVRPFLSTQLRKMIHIHMEDDMESFYKFIPRKYLPEDYGGEAASLQQLNDAMKEMMVEQKAYLEYVEKQVVNENKRADKGKCSGDVFGMEGSFRKLDFD